MPFSKTIHPPTTVLVVDDSALTLMSAVDTVEQAGYVALAADDGDEALRALRKYPQIVALFSDIHMPGPMDGLTLAREARRLSPTIKILLVSGDVCPLPGELPEDGLFLQKPYTRDEVIDALRQLLPPAGWRPDAYAA